MLALVYPGEHLGGHVVVLLGTVACARFTHDVADPERRGAPAKERFDLFDRRSYRIHRERKPVGKCLSTHLQGVSHGLEVDLRLPEQTSRQCSGIVVELLCGLCRKDQRHFLVVRHGVWRGWRRQVLFDYQVRIGAAVTEGTHRRAARLTIRAAPRLAQRVDAEWRGFEVEMRIRSLKMQGRRQFAMTHLQQDLVDSGNACRSRCVSNVALHRAQGAGIARRIGAKGIGQRFELHRIAEPCAGSMHLDVGNARGINVVSFVDLALQFSLTDRARRCDAIGLAVLVDAGAKNYTVDVVASGERVGEAA